MLADNSRHLVEAAARRRQQTLAQADQALEHAERAGEPLTVAQLAAQAGVSRSWLYTQPALVARLRQLPGQDRAGGPPAPPAAQRATETSLQRRLEAAHHRNQLLQAEVRDLRTQLARALGERRTHRHDSSAAATVADRQQPIAGAVRELR